MKHSHISYFLFLLPPPSPNTLSPAHLKHNLLSHWFLLCKLPTHHTSPHFYSITETSFSFSVQDCNKPTHWHYRHPPKESGYEQGLLSNKQLDNEIYEPPNSKNWHESIFWAPSSHPKPQVRQMSTLTAQGQTRQYQEKLITGLQTKQRNHSFEDASGSLPNMKLLISHQNKTNLTSIAYFIQWFPVWFVSRT